MLLPEVLNITHIDDHVAQVNLDLRIQATLAYFEGHFPDLPILPGVVQVDWAVRLARQYLVDVSGQFTALEKIKFQSLVLPEAKLVLSLTWHAEKQAIGFTYHTDARQYSSGLVVLGGD